MAATAATCTTDACPHCTPLRERIAELLAYIDNARSLLALADR